MIADLVCHYLLSMVHPLGMPLTPVVHPVIDAALVKVPLEATPLSQLFVHSVAEILVARQVTLFRLVQP